MTQTNLALLYSLEVGNTYDMNLGYRDGKYTIKITEKTLMHARRYGEIRYAFYILRCDRRNRKTLDQAINTGTFYYLGEEVYLKRVEDR